MSTSNVKLFQNIFCLVLFIRVDVHNARSKMIRYTPVYPVDA